MSIEAVHLEQLMGCKDSITQIIKGKRTKRQRAQTLTLDLLGMAHSSTTSSSGGRTSDGYDSGTGYEHATTSKQATSSDEFTETAELEEDMANCLILLSQGQRSTHQGNRKFSQSPGTAAISNAGTNMKKDAAIGIYAYQCKTCEKCFPSFQALGGHRTSHNKLKMTKDQEKQLAGSGSLIDQESDVFRDTTTMANANLSPGMSNGVLFSIGNRNKQKLHECSLCGAVFSSGQALGGHMRRHRSFANNTTWSMRVGTSGSEFIESSNYRNTMKLDLNLPAPDDDQKETEFSFQPKEKVLVLSATSLVDCPLQSSAVFDLYFCIH